jgi:hypothetical protein
MKLCKDCRYILKPSGALYEPHPESICTISLTINYVTGGEYYRQCKEVNIKGNCKWFRIKETP